MEQNYEQDYGAVLMDLLATLKEKLVLIILVTALSLLVGVGASVFLMNQEYEASVNMIVNVRADMNTAITSDDIYSSQNLVDTYAIVIKSNTVLNQVIEELELDMRFEELYEIVTVDPINNTQVMKIAVRHEDPATAYAIADTMSRIAPAIVKDAVEAGSCKMVSQVYVGDRPVSPNIRKNAAICAMLGFVLCVGTIVLQDIRNDCIIDDGDITRKLGLPTLGVIPDLEVK